MCAALRRGQGRFGPFGRFGESERADAVHDRRGPLALAQLTVELHARIAEFPQGSSLRGSMARRTTRGKDVTTVLVGHENQLHQTANHATCQGRFATKREALVSQPPETCAQPLAVAQSGKSQGRHFSAVEVSRSVSSTSGLPAKLTSVLLKLASPRFIEKPIELIQCRLQRGHFGRSLDRTLTSDDLFAHLLQGPHVGLLRQRARAAQHLLGRHLGRFRGR